MQVAAAMATKSIKQQTNIVKRFWMGIDWDQILAKIVGTVFEIVLITVLFVIINKIVMVVIERSFKTYQNTRMISEGRAKTIYSLIRNSARYILYFFYLYGILSLLGVPVGTLIASAGIFSVALGLGAQSLVRDILSGFFILLEQQLDVGDHVKIGTVEGTVVALGLKTTQIKSFDGTLNYIPNSTINMVSNLSRSNMRVQIDVRIAAQTDSDQVTELLNQVNEELTPNYPEIKTGPDIFGVVDLGNGNLAIRVILYTENGAQGRIQSDFLAAYIQKLTAAGIKMPANAYPTPTA